MFTQKVVKLQIIHFKCAQLSYTGIIYLYRYFEHKNIIKNVKGKLFSTANI